MKKTWLFLTVLVSAVAVFAGQEQWVLKQYIKNNRVDTGSTRSGLNVRSGPGTNHSTVGALEYGERVTIYQTQNGWCRISPPQQAEASATDERWVLAKYIKNGRINTGSSKTGLNVRSGPGSNYSPIDALEYGEAVTVYDQKNGWARISPSAASPESKEQWILAQYVKNGAIDTGNTGSGLNVRSGPGRNYSAVATLKDGDKVTEYERKDGWVRISPDAMLGGLVAIFGALLLLFKPIAKK